MKRGTRLVLLAALVTVALLMLSGCDPVATMGEGTLSIALGSSRSLMLLPEIDMEIATYTISGSGPNGGSFEEEGFGGFVFERSGLAAGDWEITVDGYNAGGTRIGTAVVELTIRKNQTTSATATLRPLEGTGTFSGTVSWTDSQGVLSDPQVWVTVRDEEGDDIQDISIPTQLDVEGSTANGSSELPAGWYEVTVGLYEGVPGGGSVVVWQGVLALRIVADQTTSGTLEIPEEQIRFGTGGVSIVIEEDMDDPFDVFFTVSPEAVVSGEAITFTSKGSHSDSARYRWYVDGERQEGNSAVFSHVFEEAGVYTVSLLVVDGGALCGYGQSVEVAEIENSITVRLTSLADPTEIHEVVLDAGLIGDFRNEGIPNILVGDPIAMRLDSSTGNYYGTFFYVFDAPVLEDEQEESTSLLYMMVPMDAVGSIVATSPEVSNGMPIPNLEFNNETFFPEYKYIDLEQRGSTESVISISEYGPVGGMIAGTVTIESTPVYGYVDATGQTILLGDYKLECFINVVRMADVVFYSIQYDGNGAVSGNGPGAQDYPEGIIARVSENWGYDGEPFEKPGYVFSGWNTKADGSGTTYLGGDTFVMPDRDVTLYAIWEEPFSVFTGPAGGHVFYDKGEFSDGWRYLEAYPEDLTVGSDSSFIWGEEGVLIGTDVSIGSGGNNTDLIVSRFGEGDYVAYLCQSLERLHEDTTYSDWFLPSRHELNEMFKHLKTQGLGGFSDYYYWSSSEDGANFAWPQYFLTGFQCNSYSRNNAYRVRPVRAF